MIFLTQSALKPPGAAFQRWIGKVAAMVLLTVNFSSWGWAGVAIQHWQTEEGLRVYFVAAPGLPMLDAQLDVAAGSAFDPPGKSGLAALTRSLLPLGAGLGPSARDETAIAEQMADLGAQFSGSVDVDRASLRLRTLTRADSLEPAWAIFREMLQTPHFSSQVVLRERNRMLAGLKEADTKPEHLASKAFWGAMYPAHPYGRHATAEQVQGLTAADLRRFHQRHYGAERASLALVGDLSRAEAERLAASLSRGLPNASRDSKALAPLPAPAKPAAVLVRVPHPATQAHIYLGMPAIERGHPDFFPLLVGNYTLGGGGFVSRLMKEVRDQRGYAYSVYSYFMPLAQPGPFQIALQTKRDQASAALSLSRDLLETFLKEGPSEEELAAAKANLSGSFPLRLDSNKKLLDNLAVIGFYRLPLDYLDTWRSRIESVTVDEVRRAFSRHVSLTNLVTVVVAGE